MKQKLLAMMFALFAVQAIVWAQTDSGYCGDPNVNEGMDVTWELRQDEDRGTPCPKACLRGWRSS